jgi:hypothetical protein
MTAADGPAGSANGRVLLLPDAPSLADLATFVGRARRADPDGAARLRGHGDVLAVYVSPLHGGGGPTVLGLRTLALARPSELDVTVPLASLLDRFAREPGAGPAPGGHPGTGAPGDPAVPLAVPPAEAVGVAWAGMSPPRRGWDAVGLVDAATMRRAAEAGVAEVAAGTPSGAGAHAVARLRAQVWGRPLGEGLDGVPAGVAFAADALGFTTDGEPAALYRAGSWVRVTTGRGHVLARTPAF